MRSELRQLILLAIPLILAQLAQTSMSFVDTLMVGRLGSEDLAGIALGSTIFHFLQLVLTGIILAVSPTVSQAHGANNPNEISRAVRQGVWLAVLFALPATLLLWQVEPLLLRMGQNPDTVALSSSYLKAVSFGLLPALCIIALRGLLEGISITKPIMLIGFIGVALNIVTNNALIFGRWGFPELGLVGAGYATSFVYSMMLLAYVIYISKQYASYRILTDLIKPDLSMLASLLRIGIPIGLILGFETGMFAMTALLMGLIGAAELAAHQITMQTASMTFMVPLGLSIATAIRVGQAIGRKDYQRAQTAGYLGIAICAAFMCLTALLFWVFPREIISLYLRLDDPANSQVIQLATGFFALAAAFQIFDGLQVSAAGALRGLKDTRIPMLITLFSYWLVGMGSGILLAFQLGLKGTGLWLGLLIGLAVAGLMLTWRFRHLMYKHSRFLEKPVP